MVPTMNLRREVFQHDYALPHTARATVDFLVNQNVKVLPFVGDLGHLMVFLLLSRFGFSDEVPGCRDPGLLMCNRLMVGTTYIVKRFFFLQI
jgi:hypothetical protein